MKITTLKELEKEANKHADKGYIGDILQSINELKEIIRRMEEIKHYINIRCGDKGLYNMIDKLIADLKGEEI
jgi:hypothetical protein